MRQALRALGAGLQGALRLRGLVVALWLLNLGLAALLAVPLAARLEAGLAQRGAASSMLYGFDHDWWAVWHAGQDDYARELHPRILGRGRPLRNLELLLDGMLPLGLFAEPGTARLDALILGLGALYALVQSLLGGGVLALLRGGSGWSLRQLLHATGFYAARLLRLLAVSLLVVWLVFAAAGPLAAAFEGRAAASASEASAGRWLLAARAPALAGLLLAVLIGSWSRAILVVEERRSALLAWLQALGLCLRHPVATGLVSGGALALGIGLVLAWALLEERLDVTGYRTQLPALVLGQAMIAARIGLRVAHAGAQVELIRLLARGRSRGSGVPGPDGVQVPPT